MTALSHLLVPIDVGQMTVKNRIVTAPMERNYAHADGTVSEQTKVHYEAVARGGVGWIDVEATFVDPIGRGRAFQLGIDRDECVPGLRELVECVHRHNVRIGIEIQHSGRCTSSALSGFQPVAPSPVPEPTTGGEMPHELTVAEIDELVARHGEAARRAAEAGFDAVELHSAHGYLALAFLSPLTNRRLDDYGGSLENRMRFPLRLIEAFRANVPETMTLGCRFSASEFVTGGLTLDDTVPYAQALETAGVHYLHVSGGNYTSMDRIVPAMNFDAGWLIDHAAAIKAVVSIPVIGVSRFTDPRDADRVIAEGKADLVAFGRAFLADPDFPRKAAEGRYDEIVSCIGCNQGCIERMAAQRDITCLVNPVTGREHELALQPAAKPKRVLVIGGGPAGMEAARVAAERGHQVTLLERETVLGGQTCLAAELPGRNGWATFVREGSRRLDHVGVDVRVGEEVDADLLRRVDADAIVFATGAEFAAPDVGHEPLLDAKALLEGVEIEAARVVVAGDGAIGLGVADWLATRGKRVSVLVDEGGPSDPGGQIGLVARLSEGGLVEFRAGRALRKVGPGYAVIGRAGAFGPLEEEQLEGAVVFAGERRPLGALAGFAATMQLAPEIYTIGDCKTPRSAFEAIREGALVGREI